MFFNPLLFASSLLATAVVAVPTSGADAAIMPRDTADGEMQFLKRDFILGARDLDVADLNGVNMTNSMSFISERLTRHVANYILLLVYKHAHIKRDDGDDIHIWVDRGFIEHDEEELAKRQEARPVTSISDGISDYCRDHARNDATGPDSPFSGGTNALYRWARSHHGGSFSVSAAGGWKDLIVAGTNSGANAVYRASIARGGGTDIGTQDIRNDADWTRGRARNYNGRWRAQSYGRETCFIASRLKFEITNTNKRV